MGVDKTHLNAQLWVMRALTLFSFANRFYRKQAAFYWPRHSFRSDQLLALFDNAFEVAKSLGLEIGKAPTQEQLAKLDQDIICGLRLR